MIKKEQKSITKTVFVSGLLIAFIGLLAGYKLIVVCGTLYIAVSYALTCHFTKNWG